MRKMIPRRVTLHNDFQGEGDDISWLDGVLWFSHGRGEGNWGSTNEGDGDGDGKSGGWGEEGDGDGDMLGGEGDPDGAGSGSGDDGSSIDGNGDGDGGGKQIQQLFSGGVVGSGDDEGNAHLKVVQSTSFDKNLWQSNAGLCIGLSLRQFCWSANEFKFKQAGLSSEK